MPKRRAHVALIGFESVDLVVGGSFASTSVGCCREGMLDACDLSASRWCFPRKGQGNKAIQRLSLAFDNGWRSPAGRNIPVRRRECWRGAGGLRS